MLSYQGVAPLRSPRLFGDLVRSASRSELRLQWRPMPPEPSPSDWLMDRRVCGQGGAMLGPRPFVFEYALASLLAALTARRSVACSSGDSWVTRSSGASLLWLPSQAAHVEGVAAALFCWDPICFSSLLSCVVSWATLCVSFSRSDSCRALVRLDPLSPMAPTTASVAAEARCSCSSCCCCFSNVDACSWVLTPRLEEPIAASGAPNEAGPPHCFRSCWCRRSCCWRLCSCCTCTSLFSSC
mmetsp:Transcript_20834/g.62070  ORF Transcript_20834/g.62070 Transcript_20834/m.62070 type:complete len:241 (-) Transcript_20834:1042-1764(-)